MKYLLIALVSLAAKASFAEHATRLDAFNLLQVQKEGEVQTVAKKEDWSERRSEILAGMQRVMGPFPDRDRRADLKITVVEESDVGSYVLRLITYEADADTPTPAYLCIPKEVLAGKRKANAVLCLHPTDDQFGHKVVVGLGGRAGRQYAAELAHRGYITLSPAYPHLANYWPNLGKLNYDSGTMKAIWDNVRALDMLSEMEEVDTSAGFACIGHSLGGHNGIFTTVFDDRIKIVVTSCGFDSFQDYYDGDIENWFFGKGWCQIRYMPKMSDYRERLNEIPFDFSELLAAIAPRSVFISAPKQDNNFRWKSVEKCVDAAQPVFKLFECANQLSVEYPDTDHNFPAEVRQHAYEKIDSWRQGH